MKANATIEETGSIAIDNMNVSAYTIPTDLPESDGTIEWDSTTLVLVEIAGNGKKGIGYTYADAATAFFIDRTLKPLVQGRDTRNSATTTSQLIKGIRNNGSCGIAMMAVSAVDNALWDLKARITGLPLCDLLGCVRENMKLYGSGGFTNYTEQQTARQFEAWATEGITHFKMKVGREPGKDLQRVRAARMAIGDAAVLMVDANGAYNVRQALRMADTFVEYGVTWMEEPVSSDDLRGLRFIRDHAPAGCAIAAGEYGYNLPYFETMLHAGAVDVLQADATRCGGISFLLKAGYLCEAHQLPFSTHCAPSLHLHASLALPAFSIAEYFHDHVRIESMLFDGVSPPVAGCLKPDRSRPGLGLEFKHADANKYKL
ncbi:MAG TPA: enolase C-terminal domain-like protein [Puia sp.]|jgi:L-alanine-DL-glutamate epimerase-like enolase superfamily enzyme